MNGSRFKTLYQLHFSVFYFHLHVLIWRLLSPTCSFQYPPQTFLCFCFDLLIKLCFMKATKLWSNDFFFCSPKSILSLPVTCVLIAFRSNFLLAHRLCCGSKLSSGRARWKRRQKKCAPLVTLLLFQLASPSRLGKYAETSKPSASTIMSVIINNNLDAARHEPARQNGRKRCSHHHSCLTQKHDMDDFVFW